MTPKEKAENLIYQYTFSCRECDVAKISATICVDEIIKAIDKEMQGFMDSDIIAYWKTVKNEIDKL